MSIKIKAKNTSQNETPRFSARWIGLRTAEPALCVTCILNFGNLYFEFR